MPKDFNTFYEQAGFDLDKMKHEYDNLVFQKQLQPPDSLMKLDGEWITVGVAELLIKELRSTIKLLQEENEKLSKVAPMKLKVAKKTVVFDFDGVIHSYTSGWQGETVIPDPPVPWIRETIRDLREDGYKVVVVSTRAKNIDGCDAIYGYLNKHEIEVDDVTWTKPPAICYIDDRAICFDGQASTLVEKVKNFKTWQER